MGKRCESRLESHSKAQYMFLSILLLNREGILEAIEECKIY